ncbi:MAG: ribonuclease III [Verrucomicrobia bacterium]|nr:ribonuclease III [Verrucomicrobiota bacterium]
MSDLGPLQSRLGYAFRDVELLRLAVTHPSVAHEHGNNVHHNQRLEFLGDAVLQLVLTRVLYERFPDFGEGPLTKARAQLVNRRSLAEHGRRLELGQHLILSRGEELNGGRDRPSTLADAFEALLGAIFMDGGFESAQEFILRQFRDVFGDLEVLPNLENPKGELQEVLQARSPEPPRYIMLSVSGPDHDRVFECAVFYRKEELGRGSGKSKKEAESQAALNALVALHQSTTEANEPEESEAGDNP